VIDWTRTAIKTITGYRIIMVGKDTRPLKDQRRLPGSKGPDYWDLYWFTLFAFRYPRQPWPADYKPHLSSVYVFEAGDAVKVGVSMNPQQRLRQLQNGQDRPICAYWAMQFCGCDAREVERLVHKRLKESDTARAKGEWYYLAPQTAVSVIQRIVEEGKYWGEPDPAYGLFRDDSLLLAQLEAQ
jgi:hypothetical protein